MSRRRSPFDDRLKRLEQEADVTELDEVDRNIYAVRRPDGVYSKVGVHKDEDGQDYYGFVNCEGAIERMPEGRPSRKSILGKHRPKYGTSGTS